LPTIARSFAIFRFAAALPFTMLAAVLVTFFLPFFLRPPADAFFVEPLAALL
jgi:hypothetical protein